MAKYVIHPGYVESQNDRDIHWISAPRLARLYNVNPKDCLYVENEKDMEGQLGSAWNDYTHLYPRYDGNYTLPEEL